MRNTIEKKIEKIEKEYVYKLKDVYLNYIIFHLLVDYEKDIYFPDAISHYNQTLV